MTEQWKEVIDYEGLYEVSNLGRVRSLDREVYCGRGGYRLIRGKLKKPTANAKDKRMFVLLWNSNKCKAMKVHRLVLFAFIGPPEPGQECCHNDGNFRNNKLLNLRWDTASSNQMDRADHGTSNRGERCAAAKLTAKQVLAIRSDPRMHKEIAAEYGVRASQISRIKNRVRWGHL